MPARGGTVTELQADAAYPSFSPDGTRIVFASGRAHNGSFNDSEVFRYADELYVINRDVSNLIRLTFTPNLDERVPSFSPDGHEIVFERGRDGNAEGTGVYTMPPSGTSSDADRRSQAQHVVLRPDVATLIA